MQLRINIQADNDAFEEGNREGELARIIRDISQRLEEGEEFGWFLTLFDINGNDVGRVALKEHFD